MVLHMKIVVSDCLTRFFYNMRSINSLISPMIFHRFKKYVNSKEAEEQAM